jgi:beta-phosphoglucomutase-like phosphatase (HAD superfamily)
MDFQGVIFDVDGVLVDSPQVRTEGRLPERVEVTAYYVVAEALTNVA